MHLSVDQRLQEVASFKRNKYFPQEIDMALNKAMFRLLKHGVQTKFQDDQISLVSVAGLIEKNRFYDLIIPGVNDVLNEPNILSQYCVLPNDLYWAINTRVETVTDPLNCSTAPTLATTNQLEYIAIVGLPTQITPGAPYFPSLSISSNTASTLYTAPSELAAGVQDLNQLYLLTDNVVESFYRNRVVRCYFERYRDTFSKGKFIFVSNAPLGNITITATGYTPLVVASTQATYTIYDRAQIANLASKAVTTSTPRTHEQDTIYQAMAQNRYYAPKAEEPLQTQTQDYFIVYRDKSYILTRLWTDYIRKPRTISLALNQGCELSEATHQKVVDLAVEILRLDIKDPAYQLSVQDTQLRS